METDVFEFSKCCPLININELFWRGSIPRMTHWGIKTGTWNVQTCLVLVINLSSIVGLMMNYSPGHRTGFQKMYELQNLFRTWFEPIFDKS